MNFDKFNFAFIYNALRLYKIAPIYQLLSFAALPQIKYSKMPGTGPVYQPTTVSYETRPGLLAQTAASVRQSPLLWLRRPLPHTLLLVCALAAIAAGIAMIVNGAADYEDTEEHRAELAAIDSAIVVVVTTASSISAADASTASALSTTTTTPTPATIDANAAAAKAAAAAEEAGETVDVCLVVAGIVLTLCGFGLAGLYVKLADWRRSNVCPCGLSKKHQGLARQMQQDAAAGGIGGGLGASGHHHQLVGGGSAGLGSSGVCAGGGQMMAMNPSTDPLVSHTQYAPVSELPSRPEDEECRTLMLDNKEW